MHLSSRSALVAFVLALVACKESAPSDEAKGKGAADKPAATASAPAKSAAATPSAGAPATTSATASASASASEDAEVHDETAKKAVEQKHGDTVWAVYVVKGATQDEPLVKAAIAGLGKRGLAFGKTLGFGSLGCDVGAADALGLPGETNAVAVYFAKEADAKAFAGTLKPKPLGIAKIKAMCRD
jgi:hypothetical protein